MARIAVDFLAVATVKRTLVIEVPDEGTAAEKLALARRKATIEMAKNEDRDNVTGSWSPLRLLDPPFIDSAPRFVSGSLDPQAAAAVGGLLSAAKPKTLFG
jgi:hypothetical protein